MSILVEIAERADVSVERVVRVRPGHGAPAENCRDEPIVDSEFVLSR